MVQTIQNRGASKETIKRRVQRLVAREKAEKAKKRRPDEGENPEGAKVSTPHQEVLESTSESTLHQEPAEDTTECTSHQEAAVGTSNVPMIPHVFAAQVAQSLLQVLWTPAPQEVCAVPDMDQQEDLRDVLDILHADAQKIGELQELGNVDAELQEGPRMREWHGQAVSPEEETPAELCPAAGNAAPQPTIPPASVDGDQEDCVEGDTNVDFEDANF